MSMSNRPALHRPGIALLLLGQLLLSGGCSGDPPPDETPSYEEWVDRYFAEDGMYCMMQESLRPQLPVRGRTVLGAQRRLLPTDL